MASTESATKLSGILASLSETLGEFRAESEDIESKFFELVGEIAQHDSAASSTTVVPAEPSLIAVERLDDLDRSIARQGEEFSGKQDKLSDDVGQLRDLVDQQVQLFAAWVNATNKGTKRKGNRPKVTDADALQDVVSQLDELQEAAEATASAS